MSSRARPVLAGVFRNRDLRRVALSYAGFISAEYAVWIAMLVYAFGQGGATTAGLVALVQLVPAALFTPYGGVLADRRSPPRVLIAAYLVQGAAMGATALAFVAGGPPVLAYLFATVGCTAVTVTGRPKPCSCQCSPASPTSLAFNVVSGWIESACIFVAPAITGVVLAVSTVGAVFALCTVPALASAAALTGLARRASHKSAPAESAVQGTLDELAEGFRAVGGSPASRLLVLLLAAEYVVIGAFDVLAVVLAIDVLDLGESGVGYLNTALGAGAVLGAIATVTLIGRQGLALPVLTGAALMGAPLVLLGAFPTVLGAFVLLGAVGVGRIVLDVSGRTLLQRVAQPDVLSRTFALLEALSMVGLALGSVLVPALVAAGGAEAALIGSGILLPAVALLRIRTLLAIDSMATVPIVEVSLLRSIKIFALLPAPVLESLARNLIPERVPAGNAVIREGEPGDRYYAIADGEVDISVNGRALATRRRGEGIGEIALLKETPRNATAVARTDVLLYALEKEPFVTAVTGHAPAARAAEEVVRERLVTLPAEGRP